MQLAVAGNVLFRPLFGIQITATVYKCPPLWQMSLWHQVAHAIAIPSGMISLCNFKISPENVNFWGLWYTGRPGLATILFLSKIRVAPGLILKVICYQILKKNHSEYLVGKVISYDLGLSCLPPNLSRYYI